MELHGQKVKKVSNSKGGVSYNYFANDEHFKYDVDETVSTFLYQLNWEYNVGVTGIGVDMWMGIALQHHSENIDFYIQCDTFESGIKAAAKICGMLCDSGVLKS